MLIPDQIKKFLTNHQLQYIFLIGYFGISLWLLVIFKHNNHAQLIVSFGVSLVYFLWGIVHHASERRLAPHIIVEYALISLLSLIMLLLLLQI